MIPVRENSEVVIIYPEYIYIYTLVGGFNNLEKYEFVNGKDYPIYYGK